MSGYLTNLRIVGATVFVDHYSNHVFVYLMKDVGEKDFLGRGCGTWFYSESIYTENGKYTEGPFKPLEIDAVKDHINILKRSYKLGEVA